MRAMILRAIPVGVLLWLLAMSTFVVLAVLSLMSKKAERKFKKMFEGERDELVN